MPAKSWITTVVMGAQLRAGDLFQVRVGKKMKKFFNGIPELMLLCQI